MSTIPGLTCATCHGPLYPHQAKRTDEGWRHNGRARNACNSIRVARENAHKVAARREDVLWMTETGETFSGVATRLGITNQALEAWLRRNDLEDIRARLLAREPGATTKRRSAA